MNGKLIGPLIIMLDGYVNTIYRLSERLHRASCKDQMKYQLGNYKMIKRTSAITTGSLILQRMYFKRNALIKHPPFNISLFLTLCLCVLPSTISKRIIQGGYKL